MTLYGPGAVATIVPETWNRRPCCGRSGAGFGGAVEVDDVPVGLRSEQGLAAEGGDVADVLDLPRLGTDEIRAGFEAGGGMPVIIGGRGTDGMLEVVGAISDHFLAENADVLFIDYGAEDRAETLQAEIEEAGVLVVDRDRCARRVPALLSILRGEEAFARRGGGVNAGIEIDDGNDPPRSTRTVTAFPWVPSTGVTSMRT